MDFFKQNQPLADSEITQQFLLVHRKCFKLVKKGRHEMNKLTQCFIGASTLTTLAHHYHCVDLRKWATIASPRERFSIRFIVFFNDFLLEEKSFYGILKI